MATQAVSLRSEHDSATPLELFFDLVYVFAVSQLAHHLVGHSTWTGWAQTAVMFSAVFLTWLQTTWTAIVLDVRHVRVVGMLLAIMLVGLYMNASLGKAFDGAAWQFVTAYVTINIGRDIWFLVATALPLGRDHVWRMLLWSIASGVLWLAGAAADDHARLALWAAAAVIDIAGQALAHPVPGRRLHSEGWPIPRGLVAERARLFFLIAIGETVITTGVAIADHLDDPLTLVTGTVALIGSVAVWLSYFRAHEVRTHASMHESEDPTRAAVHTFTALFFIVGALIMIAVGDEIVIANPLGHFTIGTAALVYGGPILYFAAQAWRMDGAALRSRCAAIGVLVVLGGLSQMVPPVLAAFGATATLVGIAIADHRRSKAF